MAWWRLRIDKFGICCGVESKDDGDCIVLPSSAPIVSKFYGQPLYHLDGWATKNGGELTSFFK